jgi:hypothetical protein
MIAAVIALIDTCGRRHLTIDRLVLLRGGSCMNGEKRLNSALPWPWLPQTQKALGKPESPLLIPIRNTGYARQCTRTMRRPP